MIKIEKNKEKENKNGEPIKIKIEESSLAEFVKRPLPNDEELENFEEYIKEEAHAEEINDSLNEIYHDDRGEIVNVKKLEIKKRRGFFFWFFIFLIFIICLSGGTYGAYYYFFNAPKNPGEEKLKFTIEGPKESVAGEELEYVINYKNENPVSLNNARIEVLYPTNFIFKQSSPANEGQNNVWSFPKLSPNQSGKITVKGRIIAPQNYIGIIQANFHYTPDNFSSEFKTEASLTTTIKDTGIDINLDYPKSILVDENYCFKTEFKKQAKGYIVNFRVNIEPKENIEFIANPKLNDSNIASYTVIRPGVWEVNKVDDKEQILPICFKVTKKINETENIKIDYEQIDGNTTYVFYEENAVFEVMKSDLNLSLSVNGLNTDSGVNVGQILNYSIVYVNKGESEMKDVIIMAVLDSDCLNWESLKDKYNGVVDGNTIVWTKEEIPTLSSISYNQEGTIDFSIAVKDLDKINSNSDYEIKSYAQYNVSSGGQSDNQDNKSNTITNIINSDLSLTQQILYFNADNIPVGTGPFPPEVGQTTTYKVYWKITNNLHEIRDLKVKTMLPPYIQFNDKENSAIGDLIYNSQTGEIEWNIGKLPLIINNANTEFSISYSPQENDRNKVMILMNESQATATDSISGAQISVLTPPKTTKLEDDDIAKSDGRVR